MPLKKSVGNMYPWVTHTHAHLGGECPHKCVYCYVDNPRFGRPKRYQGPLCLIEKEFRVNYDQGKTIFIEHTNDLFARKMPYEFIERILRHCLQWPDNTYVFQSKNPIMFLSILPERFPPNAIFGCTIETNRDEIIQKVSEAPAPEERFEAMYLKPGRKFVTIEPVLDFDVDILAAWIAKIRPEFLNLGADSKDHNLPEPTIEKIEQFTEKLREYGIELREKHNLERLKRK